MSEDNQTIKIAVGDQLAFNEGYGKGHWTIRKVESITKTGRIKCGIYTLRPDLSVMGKRSYGTAYRGQIITDKIRAEYKRQLNLSVLQRTDFHKLSDLELETIIKVLEPKTIGQYKGNQPESVSKTLNKQQPER